MSLRKAAFLAFLTAVLSLPWPIWNAFSRSLALGVTGSHWFILPAILGAICFGALMPAFYFALSRDPGPMRFSRGLRKLAFAAAATICIAGAIRAGADPRITWYSAPGLLSWACYIVLLVTMSREGPEENAAETPPPQDLLVGLTKITVLLWGLWVAFQFVRIIGVVFTYSEVERIALRVRRAPPTLRAMPMDVVLALLSQASLLAAPYIVWRSGFGRSPVTE